MKIEDVMLVLEARRLILDNWVDEGRDMLECDEEAVIYAVWALVNKKELGNGKG